MVRGRFWVLGMASGTVFVVVVLFGSVVVMVVGGFEGGMVLFGVLMVFGVFTVSGAFMVLFVVGRFLLLWL